MRALVAALVVAALGLVGCADGGTVQEQAVGRQDGLQLSGQLNGRRLSVSDGSPEFAVEDCDPPDGPDDDVCLVARTIDGATLGFVIENPAAFSAGTVLTVGDGRCSDDCDAVVDVAVIELRMDGTRYRASGGSVTVAAWGERYSVEFSVRFPDGSAISGSFDVAERVEVSTP